MEFDVVSHIAKLEDLLITEATDQNLVFSASVRVGIGVSVILSFNVDFYALI